MNDTTTFITIPSGVLKLGPKAIATYAALAGFADKDGICWPSQQALADLISSSIDFLAGGLALLRDNGWVEWNHRKGPQGRSSNLYRLTKGVAMPSAEPAQLDLTTSHTPPPNPHIDPTFDGGPQRFTSFTSTTPTKSTEPATLFEDPQPATPPWDFDDFWNIYPRRAGKGAARKAWIKACKTTPATVILAAARRYAADPNLPDDKNYIPHPSTWLNQERWEDDPLPARRPPADQNSNIARIERLQARIAARQRGIVAI